MKMLGRFILLVVLVSLGTVLWSSPVQAGVSCHHINARGVGQDLGGGVTQARIIGGGCYTEQLLRALRSLALREM